LKANNKLKKITKIMGCGCKKKQNQASQVKQGATPPQQATPASVQESIKKVVEKYYKNK
jgi:hypothetical protein